MKIQKKDQYHGSALTQIIEDPLFTALNKADEKYGHYQINHNKRILVKHTSNDKSPWLFTLKPEDIDTVVGDISSDQELFLCLVCGTTTICILTTEEFEQVIDISGSSAQWVRIECPKGSGMRVTGSAGPIRAVIPHSSFPKKLFSNESA